MLIKTAGDLQQYIITNLLNQWLIIGLVTVTGVRSISQI